MNALTDRRSGLRRSGLLATGLVLLALVFGCAPQYAPTPLPQAPPSTTLQRIPPAAQDCDDATTSYDPADRAPTVEEFASSPRLQRIRERGRLIAGVSGDTYLLGARNPATGAIEGFDIDMVKAIAKAIFGDETKYQLRVITAADRIPVLQERDVDIVVRAMTMTCDRWEEVAFSGVYYNAGQKVLAKQASGITSVPELADRTVCAPNGTSSIDNLLRRVPDARLVPADNHTGCLRLFQSGVVDAITGDDTVLAGLAAQDPYASVLPGEAFSAEPYGIAVNSEDVEFATFINARLDQMRGNGEWQASYDRWLAPTLGKATPPTAEYGR
ncbi:glutamate ABC transporter substrate-binding protein [Propionibacteriaceae bacterium Y2011]